MSKAPDSFWTFWNQRKMLLAVALLWISNYIYAVCVRKSAETIPIYISPPSFIQEKKDDSNELGLFNLRKGFNGAALIYFSMDMNSADHLTDAYLRGANNKAVVESFIAQSCEKREERTKHLQNALYLVQNAIQASSSVQGNPSAEAMRSRIAEVLERNLESIEGQLRVDL